MPGETKIDSLREKYPHIDVDALSEKFNALDTKKGGSLIQHDALKLVQSLPEKYGFDQINKTFKAHVTGGMEIDEFIEVVADLKSQGVIKPANFDPEVAALVEYINNQLDSDAELHEKLPFQPDSPQIFHEVKDGIVLAKLINKVVPGTVDESKLTKNPNMTAFQRTANQNAVIAGAKQIGSAASCGASDIESGNTKVLIGFLQSILKIDLTLKVSIKSAPEIIRLVKEGSKEDATSMAKLKTEEILIRWVNYHAERSNVTRFCTNLDKDLKDGEFFTILFKRINPQQCDNQPMKEQDMAKRGLLLVEYASRCGVNQFISADSLGNAKMNVSFLATLFALKHAILPLDQNDFVSTNTALFSSTTDRTLLSFTIWLNSFGFNLVNITEELQDGQVLAKIINRIVPGTIEWKRVNKVTTSRIKKLENANYIVDVSKKIGVVTNLGGNDLSEGNKPLLLAYLTKLQQVSMEVELKKAGYGKVATEAELIAWANKFAKLGGSKETLTSFKDSFLTTSRFFVEIIAGMNKRAVHWEFVQEGFGDEQKKDNAKYAISLTVALGILTFVGVEDILELKVKLV